MKPETNPGRISRISIKWKIFMVLAAFVAFILVLLWVMQVVFLDDFYKYIKTNEIQTAAVSLKAYQDLTELQELAEQLSRTRSMSVYAFEAASGKQLCRVLHPEAGMLPNYNSKTQREELLRVIWKNGGENLQYPWDTVEIKPIPEDRRPWRQQNLLYATAIEQDTGETVVILLQTKVTPVSATVQTIRTQLIMISIILLLLALLIALCISILISKPILKLNAASQELAKGSYAASFEATGYKEISQLSETLQYAAGELAQLDQYRKDLLANVSHDLKTPLTLISGYAEAMRDLPGENTPENLQIILDEAQRLTVLVHDVLAVSQYDAQVQNLSLQEYNLTESIQDIVDRMAQMAVVNGYDIQFTASRAVRVLADEGKLNQAVYNLLGNAITHTGRDKKVLVRQDIIGNTVRINVIDTGKGIPKDKLREIWERYYKVDQEHKRAQVGTGLGLSIVRSIFHLHGLSYGVSSSEGEGSNFWFELSWIQDEKQDPHSIK